jgi:hypothetical protein
MKTMKAPPENFVNFLELLKAVEIEKPPCDVELSIAAHLMGWALENDFAFYTGADGEQYAAHAGKWYFIPSRPVN